MVTRFILLFIWILILSENVIAQTSYVNKDTVVHNQINIINSDLRNATIIETQNVYMGLDSTQIVKLVDLKFTISRLNSEVAKLSDQIESNQNYTDSILAVVRQIGVNQKKIEDLERVNDSIMNSKKGDELYKAKLVQNYERRLEEQWADFWESDSAFNPNSNTQMVEYLEKANKESYGNIFISGSVNTPTYVSCNWCIRKNPHDWWGIAINGAQYKLNSDEFLNISVFVPHHGVTTIADLRSKYESYWIIVNNRYYEVDKPFEEYLEKKYDEPKSSSQNEVDRKLQQGSTITSNTETGAVQVSNNASFQVMVYLVDSETNKFISGKLYPGGFHQFSPLKPGKYRLIIREYPLNSDVEPKQYSNKEISVEAGKDLTFIFQWVDN